MSAIIVPSWHQRRVVVYVCAAAVLLVYLSLQTHFFKSSSSSSSSEVSRSVGGKQGHLIWAQQRPSKFSFVIKLLTYNRLHSLTRCLDSLSAADYGTHVIKLHVFIDHFPLSDDAVSGGGGGGGGAVDSKLRDSHDIVDYVDKFSWIHGPKEIHYRTQNAGLQGQWLEAWWPASDHEFAFMVEDDMRLSPVYFKYLTRIIETYYYNPANYDPTIFGISLQRPRFVPGKHGDPLRVDDATHLFLYQLVGTWGQLLFPKPWKEFRLWYDVHKSMNSKPLLDGMVTTGWYRRSRERIWTPWFIKFAYCKGYFNLYTHFSNEQALSVSYRDKGVNTKKEAGPDSNLIGNGSVNSWEMKPLKHLKRYDYCFHEVIQGRLIRNAQDVYNIVPSIQTNGTIILVNALGIPEEVIRNWLCQFSKFSIRNYAILLQDHRLEEDLLLRGHTVMNLNPGLPERGFDQIDSSDMVCMNKILATVQAITWLLQAGYNVWTTNIDTIWVANPFPHIRIDNADMLGFAAGTGISTELLYIKGSKVTLSLWRSIYNYASNQAESLTSSRSSELRQDFLEDLVGRLVSRGTLSFKLLPHTLKANILTAYRNDTDDFQLPATLLTGIQINHSYVNVSKSFGLWKLDGELTCTGIYC